MHKKLLLMKILFNLFKVKKKFKLIWKLKNNRNKNKIKKNNKIKKMKKIINFMNNL
jgi:hypothetical protein